MWDQISQNIREKIGSSSFQTWFNFISPFKCNEKEIIFLVPNVYYKEHIETHYLDVIQQSVKKVLKHDNFIPISFLVDSSASNISLEQHIPTTFFNANFSFYNFVVGPNNSFAHAVALAVAESPGHAYNPLFIYGKVGLGKTHLMQAIGQCIQEKKQNKSILYISSEKFTNELITALQNNVLDQFQNKYRNLDVLLIDDIQFIAGKERTQEEFFHTFNHLHNNNKQIVLSADKPPKEIYLLEERLLSRFEWGIIADIQPPDFETRIAILRKKAEKMILPVPQEIFEFIAANFTSNIRELEGALTRVVALGSLKKMPLTLELTKDILKDSLSFQPLTITIEHIQKTVAHYFDLSIQDLKSHKRNKTLVYPRQLAMYLTRKITNCSFPEIGESFGGKDHSTVIHACEKINEKFENDSSIKNLITKLEEKIRA